ncbi:monocopper oxidase-like protein SKU5 [Lolium perenne]|uniref:monocopper oxidase-like protein SKU5 n=1 Tax=Lolium perenne TaxID=4522 RepID=UPI0021EA613E|nr:monocopper oxidase-like protein SKU5 [Lolium perenne]
MAAAAGVVAAVVLALAAVAASASAAAAGGATYEVRWEVGYMTVAPLGVSQKVIAINNQFPGPLLNVTTNWNARVNVQNNLDEPLLLTWDGIQMRMNSWQDGVTGTNCPIPPGWNWTYQFQLKDQIGSFFYFPSLGLQRTAGGYGPVTVNNRAVVPVPFDQPDGDITLFIGDWYTKSHTELRGMLDDGKDLGIPDGILINAKGPYRYDTTLVPEGLQYEIVGVEPGKTYRFRVHNVGTSTSLNFRIQNHNMLLVEAEGTYTNQQNYSNLDIHVGQSYSFLVTMDQNASTDYYIVASPRFVSSEARWHDVNGVAILQYSNSKGSASGPLPDAPNDFYDKYYSVNQARSIRMNTSSGAARPNPQGSFRYGSINITQTFVLKNESPLRIDGKRRRTINRVSYSPPETPLRLADLHNLTGVYKTDFPTMPSDAPARSSSSVLNASYKGFLEIVFQNNETDVQTYHLDGYSFFVVGMDYGEWTPNSRGSYNRWDAVFRSTTQVFPGGWTAVLVSLDNVGIWNLRAEKLDNWYNGQEVYVKVADPLGYNVTEMIAPDNTLYCGRLEDLQKPQIHPISDRSSGHALARWSTRLLTAVSLIVTAVICS